MIPSVPPTVVTRAVTQPLSRDTGSLAPYASANACDFWELWNQCKGDLLRQCLRWMGGNRADAEDALSEASLRAYHAWLTKPPEFINFKGWLVRMVQNHCRNIQRGRARWTRVVQYVEDISVMSDEQTAEDRTTSPENVALCGEIGWYTRRVIDDLPPRLQAPAEFYFLQEMTCPDIATRLNLSPANVRKRIQQARTLLRIRISAYLDGDTFDEIPRDLPWA